jgi:hypothetical protein
MQDSPHVPRVILCTGKLLDDLSNPGQSPQVCFEAMTLRPKTQRGIYLGQLPCIESGLTSGAPRSLELLGTSL